MTRDRRFTNKGWDWNEALRTQSERWTSAMPEVLEFIARQRAAHARRVYDLGCGVGRHTIPLAASGFDVTASDVSPSAIARTRAALDAAGLCAELLQIEMSEMPFPDSHFDAAIAINVVYHARVSEVERTINGLYRVLRANAMLMMSFKSTEDSEFGVGERLEHSTYAPTHGIERGIPHYYVDAPELRRLMNGWEVLARDHRIERGTDRTRAHWLIEARRPGD